MNKEILESLDILEKEKSIKKEELIAAIESSLLKACDSHFGKGDNYKAFVDKETGDFKVYVEKTVVVEVLDPNTEISLAEAKMINSKLDIGDLCNIDVKSKEFSRIAAQNAKNVITQAIREAERKSVYDYYHEKEHELVTGIVQKINGDLISINIGKTDAVLTKHEQVKGEAFVPTDRIKLYVVSVTEREKGSGFRILVSRSHPELVRKLFESEVAEIKDGTVVIKAIAREAGARTKIAVQSLNPDVEAVGACVGVNGARINSIINELRGEKIDIIEWSDTPAIMIERALSPAKVVSVTADDELRTADVVVPDYQLSLAIGREGQNARLAARLTGFKIDIKSESQAKALEAEKETDEENEEF